MASANPSSRRPFGMTPLQLFLLTVGWLLILSAPVVGALPGPGGIIVFGLGLALVLRNSRWARRQYVRLKQRWPKAGHLADRSLLRKRKGRRS